MAQNLDRLGLVVVDVQRALTTPGAGVVTTNHCCETTVLIALDATHTFDRIGPGGEHVAADELMRVTGVNLHDEFAQVVRTADLLA